MSFKKTTPKISPKNTYYSNAELAQIFSRVLREGYKESASPVKIIARQTGASISTVKKWYSGEKQPSLKYICILAQHSNNILKAFLDIIGKSNLWELYQKQLLTNNQIYSEKYFTINVTVSPEIIMQLNQRQLWYLGLLQHGHKINASNIASSWKVTVRTARADIAELIAKRLVYFRGSRKTGNYVAIDI